MLVIVAVGDRLRVELRMGFRSASQFGPFRGSDQVQPLGSLGEQAIAPLV